MQTNLGATVHEPCPVWAGSYRQSTERSRGRERERRRIRVWWPRSGHFENHCCSSAEGPEPCGHRGPQETDGQETSGLLKGECLQKTSWVRSNSYIVLGMADKYTLKFLVQALDAAAQSGDQRGQGSLWHRDPLRLRRHRGNTASRLTSITLFHTHTHARLKYLSRLP